MPKTYFFCGIGGSGMMPLALILQAQGHVIKGSDRAYDQGSAPEKFDLLNSKGIALFPQDGSGVRSGVDVLVISGAVEDTVPDVAAARQAGVPVQLRAELLSTLFNTYENGISIAGTSGKSTVTGMTATIFAACGADPTVMNGGMISNFSGDPHCPAPNVRIGQSDVFITETDESDGSIALYNPAIALVNNIALDHMPLTDLQNVFKAFLERARKAAIVNKDDPYLPALLGDVKAPVIGYGIDTPCDLQASDITTRPDGVEFTVQGQRVHLRVPGRHNVMNALAALAVARAYGLELVAAIKGLEGFTGIARRFQVVGKMPCGAIVIDDFGHNPDKIAATLQTLKQFDGRVLVMFQAHGFGPLRLMGKEIALAFAKYLSPDDQLIMPEVYYAGGTVDRSVTARDLIQMAQDQGVDAHWFETRPECGAYLKTTAREGDRVVIMGARDDSLTSFAKSLL